MEFTLNDALIEKLVDWSSRKFQSFSSSLKSQCQPESFSEEALTSTVSKH